MPGLFLNKGFKAYLVCKKYLQALSWYLLAGRAGADRACCLLARAAEIYLMGDAGEYPKVTKCKKWAKNTKKYPKLLANVPNSTLFKGGP